MSFIKYNPNPCNNYVGDCVIRAICTAMSKTWQETYIDICICGYMLCDMPSSNKVWKHYLLNNGYEINIPTHECTIAEFCREHEKGTYILGTGEHVVAAIDGSYFDTWNSGDEMLLYYFSKE